MKKDKRDKNTVSIIVPAVLNPESARQCMDVLLEQKGKSFEIILLTDKTYKCRHTENPRVEVVEIKNYGGSKIKTLASGLKPAGGDIIVWIDPHYIPEGAGWLENLLRPFEDDSVGAVSGRVRPLCEGGNKMNRLLHYTVTSHSAPQPKKISEIDLLSFKCDAVRTDILRDIGVEDISSLPRLSENVELSLRIKNAGYKIMFQPAAGAMEYQGEAGKNPSIADSLLTGLSYGQADATIGRRWDVQWLNGPFFMVALISILLPITFFWGIPYAVIGAGLIFLWGWFSGFHIPYIPWEWPIALVNLFVYVVIILLIRDDWAASVFDPQKWHPAIIRQVVFVLAIPLSYVLLMVVLSCKTALKGMCGMKSSLYLPGLIILTFFWQFLLAVGYTKEKLLPKYKIQHSR